ncbi:guanylate kinase [Spizellomyces sp. 'palustris']|nr:guanylate kinase [Spizellomyces sp. 'palustris']
MSLCRVCPRRLLLPPSYRTFASAPSPIFASKSTSTRTKAKLVLAAVGCIGVGGLALYRTMSTDTPAPNPAKPTLVPRPIIICGPSGSGKSTLLTRLFKDYPTEFGFSISHTTRTPRAGETNGKEYHFTDRDTMLKSISRNEFLEHAEFASNLYGTSFRAVQSVLDANKHVILDIDVQGVQQLQQAIRNGKAFTTRPLFIFVAPPDVGVLERRLRGRGTESETSMRKRLEAATRELEWGLAQGNVDVVIVNEDVDRAYEELKRAIFGDRV